jgi:Ca2+-binding EF-hand superfamily protein
MLGGMPDPTEMVSRTMQRSDADGDGKLSVGEIATIDERWRSGVTDADANGDGEVTRAELTTSMKKRFSGGGQQ